MKLSNETLAVLKNFSTINSGLEFKSGNQIATMSPGKTVLAKAELNDSFPEDFCVFDLNQFLSVHATFQNPNLDFDEFNIIFNENKRNTKYRKTAKEMIITPPDKALTLPTVDASFKIEESNLISILKTANILQSPHIAIESDGDKICLTSFNAKDDSAHVNTIELAEGNGNKFTAVFLAENWKMISGTYDVEVSSRGLASFNNCNQGIQYWIALEAKESKFGE
jgi:hypothetical protein